MANEIITEVDASEKDPIQSIEFLSNDEEPDPEDDEDHYLYKEYSIALCSLASNRLLIMFNQPNDPDLERLVPPPKHS